MNQFTGLLGLQGTPWAGALAGVGQGLLAAGSGGNFGQGLTGGIQDWRQQQMQRQQMQREQEMFEFQRRKYEADQQAAAQAQQQQAAQAEAVKKWAATDPRVAPYADVLMANPSAAYDVLAKFAQPADQFKPNVEEFYVDGKKVKGYLDENRQLVKVGDEVPLYKPEGAGIQVDTNGDGVPDITIGGSGIHGKPTESNAQALFRGTLIGQAMDEIQSIADQGFPNISPGRMTWC